MIYIRGDTHGELSAVIGLQPQLTAGDRLIVTGDFSFVFFGEHNRISERNDLDALARLPFEILFVDGNHEGFDHLMHYPEELRWGAPVRRIRNNIFWLQRGYVYTIEGKTFFVMGGGYSLDKAWRMEYEAVSREKIWFAQELPSPLEYRRAIANLQKRAMKVDYILTHTAPRIIIPRVIHRAPDPHEAELNGFLDWIYHEAEFKKWFFGHFHMDQQVNEQMIACFETLHRLET